MGKCTLFENARFHTGRRETEVFSYMLVEKGRIKALSNEKPAPREYCRRVFRYLGRRKEHKRSY